MSHGGGGAPPKRLHGAPGYRVYKHECPAQWELSALEAELESALAGLGSLQDEEQAAKERHVAEHTVAQPAGGCLVAVPAVRSVIAASGMGCEAIIGEPGPQSHASDVWATRCATPACMQVPCMAECTVTHGMSVAHLGHLPTKHGILSATEDYPSAAAGALSVQWRVAARSS